MQKIDRDKINVPKITLTKDALSQIVLAIQNDPYLKNKYFRIHISGKGCDGFTYNTFFDEKRDDDFSINILDEDLTILMSPFTAYYSQSIELAFISDLENDNEGFVVKITTKVYT